MRFIHVANCNFSYKKCNYHDFYFISFLKVLPDRQTPSVALWPQQDQPPEVPDHRVPAHLLCGREFWRRQRESEVRPLGSPPRECSHSHNPKVKWNVKRIKIIIILMKNQTVCAAANSQPLSLDPSRCATTPTPRALRCWTTPSSCATWPTASTVGPIFSSLFYKLFQWR